MRKLLILFLLLTFSIKTNQKTIPKPFFKIEKYRIFWIVSFKENTEIRNFAYITEQEAIKFINELKYK